MSSVYGPENRIALWIMVTLIVLIPTTTTDAVVMNYRTSFKGQTPAQLPVTTLDGRQSHIEASTCDLLAFSSVVH